MTVRQNSGGRTVERWSKAKFGEKLTGRELDVVELLAQGKSNKVIGNAIGITEGTVKCHLQAAASKLGAQGRIGVLVKALQAGLVSVDKQEPVRQMLPEGGLVEVEVVVRRHYLIEVNGDGVAVGTGDCVDKVVDDWFRPDRLNLPHAGRDGRHVFGDDKLLALRLKKAENIGTLEVA